MTGSYTQAALDMVAQSSFATKIGRYVYAKVASVSSANYFLCSRDADETTIVTREDDLADFPVIERNKDTYCLISLAVAVPFYSVGFLATVSDAFAERGMNVLIVSTYSRDYILVRHDLVGQAEEIMLSLGFKRD